MKPKETVELTWSDFHTNIENSFQNARATNKFSDVTLVCDGNNNMLEAHRIVLSAGSNFFRNILSTRTVNHPHPLLYLGGVRMTDLEAVLDFLYNGHTKVAQMELLTFLQTAKRLGVTGLESEDEFCPKGDADTLVENSNEVKTSELVSKNGHEFNNTSADDDKKDSSILQSPVWRFMERLDINTAQCNICGKIKKCPSGTTSGLIAHIQKAHRKEGSLIQEHFYIKKLRKQERSTFFDKINLKIEQNQESVTELINPTKFPLQGLVYEDLPLKVKDDTNEEASFALDFAKEDQTYEKVITFDHNSIKKKNTKTSLVWKFFSFQGTQEMGPDRSRVFCSLCSHAPKFSNTTTSLINHLQSFHWEEYNLEKDNRNRENSFLEEVHEKVSGAESVDNFKTFNRNEVLEKLTGPISLCWNFFFFKGTEEDGPEKSRVYCNLCPRERSNQGVPYNGGSTSALIGHLRNNHENQLKQAEIERKNTEQAEKGRIDNSSFFEDMII